MSKYERVNFYYNVLKTWNSVMVRQAVVKGWITKTEFKEITGETYK